MRSHSSLPQVAKDGRTASSRANALGQTRDRKRSSEPGSSPGIYSTHARRLLRYYFFFSFVLFLCKFIKYSFILRASEPPKVRVYDLQKQAQLKQLVSGAKWIASLTALRHPAGRKRLVAFENKYERPNAKLLSTFRANRHLFSTSGHKQPARYRHDGARNLSWGSLPPPQVHPSGDHVVASSLGRWGVGRPVST